MFDEYNVKEATKNFEKIFDQTISNRIPIKIFNEKGKSIYLISEEDYNSMEETFYLLKNPENAEHLYNAVNEKSITFNSINDLKNETRI